MAETGRAFWPGRARATAEDVTLFTQELSWMVAAGVPLGRAVDLLAVEAAAGPMAPVLRSIRAELRAGRSLADGLAGHPALFPESYVRLVGLAEMAGTLPQVLERIHATRLGQQALQRKIRSAMMYPAFLFSVAIAAIAVIILVVVPQMKAIAAPGQAGAAEGTAMARLIALSDWLSANGLWVLAGLLVLAMVMAAALRRPSARLALTEAMARLPVIGTVIRTMRLADLTRTLAMLTDAGLPLADALRLARRTTASPALARVVADMEAALRAGDDVTAPLRGSALFPPLLVSLIRVGMETGNIGPSLRQAAQIFEDKTRHATERGLAVLEPVIILTISGVIGSIIYIVVGALMAVNDMFL